ncbi:hypothetical protein GCM10009332_21140 [Shewanella gelidii]|uniref:FAD dependent oxidoreductase domain-containing protein n=2 Tax=Shewanella gelidii TaxID=1642821 RepID=A0A917NAT5_9GAMM|nr:hypothetical protein GCM10009332_21140 [Shewanella gelidii]
MLSLAERNQSISLFCRDSGFAKAASGNKQGALYPLLTPDNGPLSQFYQQAYLYSRQRILNLTSSGKQISHDFCGVLQTGHDARSSARLNKISSGQNWPRDIMHRVDAAQANQLAGVQINQPGLFYPLGGWVCPHEFTQAAVAQAKQLSTPEIHFNTEIKKVFQQDGDWYLSTIPETETETEVDTQTLFGPFSEIVLANGQGFNQFEQTRKLAATAFRGQVSHIPTTATLNQISTVLCAQGYMTPQHNSIHCIGASYIKNATSLSHCRQEQNDNQAKIASCYPETNWIKEIDISGQDSRVGVRMVTRDHAPMVGLAPDVDRIYSLYQQRLSKDNQSKQTAIQQWKQCHAPVIEGLYVLGGLGSRGICSAPFAAEILAAQICGDIIPTNYNTLALLNPNRMWLRKLLKGKDI